MRTASSVTRRCALGAGIGAFAWLATGCDGRAGLSGLPARGAQVFGGLTMGTSYTVKVATPRSTQAEMAAAKTAVATALAEVVAHMSHYETGTELSRLNRHGLGQPLAVSASTLQVFATAEAVRKASGGAFDIALGQAVDAWGFGPSPPAQRVPNADRLRELRRSARGDALAIDAQAGTVTRLAPVHANLSGIAKGYGVDRAAQALERLGIGDYMVEVGGEVRTRGWNAERQPWQLGIERPDATPQRALFVVPLAGRSLATSGDYRNFFMHRGERLSHEIDPVTAEPVRHALASASVVADDCTLADAWSTALFVLGPERGLEVARQQGLAAYFVVRRGDGRFGEVLSPAFAALGGRRVN